MSFSTRLREETAVAHRALENSLDMMSEHFDAGRYRKIIAGFHSFVHPLTPALVVALGSAGARDVAVVRHRDRLDRDMAALQLTPRRYAGAAELPPTENSAQAWGVLYVLEGSMLGARILAPQFQQKFGIDANSGCAYFCGDINSDDELRGLPWPQFRALLDAQVAPAQYSFAIDAATQTFSMLESWLRKN